MKLISFAVPCYNSAAYMRKCIDSILVGGDEVEIIIVDDGSQKDNTLEIAREYEEKYPNICKAVHQENGGHGEAVNTGLKNATGLFFKVVDSDDWLDGRALPKVLEILREQVKVDEIADMFVCNFVYDKVGQRRKKAMTYANVFPQDEIFTWEDIKRFPAGQYILMHSVIYRTETLREAGLVLPKHTFYVDNLFIYQPLPFVKKLYYMNANLYHYFIGREDQSVNESVMISRLDQQFKVNYLMADSVQLSQVESKKLRKYMTYYLGIITVVSSVLAIKSGTEENLEKKKELWAYLKKKDQHVWSQIRFGLLGNAANLPGRLGRKLTIFVYKLAQKVYGFN